MAPTDQDYFRHRRYTDSARRVIEHVGERALDRGMIHGELTAATAEMLAVLSILRWEPKVALHALRQLGIDLDRFARDLDNAIDLEGQTIRRSEAPQIEYSPSGQKMLVVDLESPLQPLKESAEAESRQLQHEWVGTEHLLLAALRLAGPAFRTIMQRYDLDYDRVRQSVLDVLEPARDQT